jgi:hypothetical protein
MVSGFESVRLRIGEPQRPQKQRRFPGDDSHSLSKSPPEVKRNAAAETDALVAKEAPDDLRHWLQWQLVIGPTSPSTS